MKENCTKGQMIDLEKMKLQAYRGSFTSGQALDLIEAYEELKSRLESLEKDAAMYARLPLNEWNDFEYWLDRCADNGHLENCPDLVEPYENLSAAIASMQSRKGGE